jgi:hypothetical protein|tara:strand:- start:499 stop:651 length:153 start_codon:yes stop_codon:yes gene_type:complete
LSADHVSEFDITGRSMRGWVLVATEGIDAENDLKRWVQEDVAFAPTLPPK